MKTNTRISTKAYANPKEIISTIKIPRMANGYKQTPAIVMLTVRQIRTTLPEITDPANVLISDDFIYYGGGPALPIPEFNGISVCHTGRKYRCNFDDVTVQDFISWVKSLGEWGYCNNPLEWGYSPSFVAAKPERTAEERMQRTMSSAGALKGKIDGEAIKQMLYEARRMGSREVPDP